jgi:hypothetical protein
VSDFLLLFGDFKGTDILLKLSFGDPVFILDILEGDLGVLLELGQLILVLEN